MMGNIDAWARRAVLPALLIGYCAQPGAEPQTLNFKDAEIGTVIETIGAITGKTFVVDPGVSGKVTVISSAPLPQSKIYGVFENVLRVHGYAAIEDDGVVRVVPDAEAPREAVDSIGGPGEAVETHIMRIEHMAAAEAVSLLRPLLPQSAHLVSHKASNSIVLTTRASNAQRFRRILARIDRPEQAEVEVIRLQHAGAAELVRTLKLVDRRGGGDGIVADERTNSVLLSGDQARRRHLRALIAHLDTPLEAGGNSHVIHLDYADAEALVPVLEGVASESNGDGGDGNGQSAPVRIQAHPETNALIVTASPAALASLKSVIQRLDVPRAQVHVEAIIAEVSLDTARELGIQWQATGTLNPIRDDQGNVIGLDEGFIGGTNFGSGGSNILNLTTNPVGTPPSAGLNIGYISGTTEILGTEVLELGGVLRALSSDADTNVLSTPSVVTMDNAEASISVGQEVPFLTGQFTSTQVETSQGQVNPFQTINREEVGIKLTVKPKINQGDSVMLTIGQEVSSLAPSSGAVDLITNKRTLNTQVLVPDNRVLVLGGLITDDLQETVQKVPGLGDIPLLGELFKFRQQSRVKRNLMIFIRPRILRDRALMDKLSRTKYDYIRAQQLTRRETSDGFTPSEEMPLLPELDVYMQSSWANPEVGEAATPSAEADDGQ